LPLIFQCKFLFDFISKGISKCIKGFLECFCNRNCISLLSNDNENGPFEENHTNPKIKTFKLIHGWL